MVEGNTDVAYFELASRLYHKETGLSLTDVDLSIFSAGTGDAGGTRGIFEQFPTLLQIVKTDPDPAGKIIFRVSALLDNDVEGKGLYNALTRQYRDMQPYRHLFVLHHVMPRSSSEPKTIEKQIQKHNEALKGLPCEIEDLISIDLLEAYFAEDTSALRIPSKSVGEHWHHEIHPPAKLRLPKFCRQYANLEDLAKLVELLKSLRFYLGLPADGVSTP